MKPDNLAAAAAARWLALSPVERASAGLMAPSHGLREDINAIVRERLLRDGTVHGPAEGGPGADPDAAPRALPRQRHRHVRCGSQGGHLRLAVRGRVRGRAQRQSTEQPRLARTPLPELPFDDRPVFGVEHRRRRIHPVKALWLRYYGTDETLGFGPDRAPDA